MLREWRENEGRKAEGGTRAGCEKRRKGRKGRNDGGEETATTTSEDGETTTTATRGELLTLHRRGREGRREA
jgi:hypothetical protein